MLVGNSSISTQDAKQPVTSGRSLQITQAIKNAAAQTGSSFSFLLHQAAIESGFDPKAKAKTSSATGLFQFTEQTWLHMIKSRGTEYGLGNYADHIEIDSKGKAHVSEPAWQDAILNLRQNSQLAAEMSCELARENCHKLRETVGGAIGSTELYLAHFLGASGASAFLNAMRANPNTKAADVLPDTARANSSVFYGANGESRSVAQIYEHFAKKLDQPLVDVPDDHVGIVSPSLPSQSDSEVASLFASMILGQISDITSLFAVDDEDQGESAISLDV